METIYRKYESMSTNLAAFLGGLYIDGDAYYTPTLGTHYNVCIPMLIEDKVIKVTDDGNCIYITELGMALWESFQTKLDLKSKGIRLYDQVLYENSSNNCRKSATYLGRLAHNDFDIPGEYVLIRVEGEQYSRLSSTEWIEKS
jgi:hypothetical protein